MTLRYILHSGFLLETERCILVFDYWMDPTDVMREYLHTSKRVYVFASHFHEDHFTKEIFSWKESIQDITYILSVHPVWISKNISIWRYNHPWG